MKAKLFVVFLIMAVIASGCANMSKRSKCMTITSLVGAAAGAGIGTAIGHQGDTNNNEEGAAIGTGVGAMIGGALGYWLCKEDETDSDGDGVPDSRDQCPNTPIGVEVDENGCPIDSDGDGVPDYLDKCPNTPKGVKVDAKGCPMDSDGDGVPDYLDMCPNTPRGCKVDEKGCPIDSDGDGVPDCLDRCPNTPKGEKVDKYGCTIVGEHLLILEGIQFDFNSSKIKPESEQILEIAVETLKKNPNIKVEIEGHTCSTGPEEYNLHLSQKRAEAVRNYLIEQGISAGRLQTVGKGESDPIASNDTKEGRMKNRRVEFVVISK